MIDRCVWYLYSGNTPETRGSAFVIYEDIFDAKNACDHLSGFNVCNRYLVVLYYQPNKVSVCQCFYAFYSLWSLYLSYDRKSKDAICHVSNFIS